MRARGTKAALLAAAMLALACGDEPTTSADDDDGYGTETTVGGTTSATQAGSGGATTTSSTAGGSGGMTGSTAGSGGSGGSQITPGAVVITEIMNNPAAVTDANGEWFEVHNTTNQPVELAGMTIIHAFGATEGHEIASSLVVPAQGFAVLGRSSDYNVNGGVTVDYVYAGSVSLNNASDYLAIVRSDAVVIDETSWDELSGLDPEGASRSLDPAAMAATMNDDDTHFCEAISTMPYGDRGTPGVGNDYCP